MSQTTEAQTTQPTSEEVIGKVNESIAALQEAQKTVVEGAQLLAAHVNDPTAHGAAIPEVVEQQLPTPIMEGTSLKWEKKDGTIVAGPVDLKGAPGQDGADGDTGPRPEHRWEGTKLLVQNSDGSWPAEGVDLKGDKGDKGQVEGLSDAVDSDSSTTPASSKAVKTAYDKAVTAQSAADAANSKAQEAWNAAETAQSAAQAAQAAAENIGTFSGSTPGLVPASDGDATKVLLGNGTWGSAVSADDGAAVMTISEDLILTVDSPRTLVLTASASGLSVRLPDPATVVDGTTFHIIVRPLEDIKLCDYSGQPIKAYPVLHISTAIRIQLVDSASGLWALSKYENGSTSDAQGKPGLNIGELTIFSFGNPYNISLTALSESKALVCYRDSSNSSYGKACVLSISDTTVTAGSETVFNSSNTESISLTALSESKALVCYTDTSNSSYGKACVLSISGMTVSVGNQITFSSARTYHTSAAALSENKVIVCYSTYINDKYRGKARVLSISGTTISIGEETYFNSTEATNESVMVLSESKAIVFYMGESTSSYSNQFTANVLDIAGTTIGVGDVIRFSSLHKPQNISISAISEKKAIIACKHTYSSNDIAVAFIINISGEEIKIGSPIITIEDSDVSNIGVAVISSSNAIVTYSDSVLNSRIYVARVLNIEEDNIIVGSKSVINFSNTVYATIAKKPFKLSNVLAVSSSGDTNDNRGMAGIIYIS